MCNVYKWFKVFQPIQKTSLLLPATLPPAGLPHLRIYGPDFLDCHELGPHLLGCGLAFQNELLVLGNFGKLRGGFGDGCVALMGGDAERFCGDVVGRLASRQ
jgi:hypothetical protein